MADILFIPRTLVVDLTEFGFGIRDVRVLSGSSELIPGIPIPHDTVDSDSIIDGSVQEVDLNDSVKGRMTVTHDSTTGGLRLGGYAVSGSVPADDSNNQQQNGQQGTQEAGAAEDEVSGDGPDLDDLDDIGQGGSEDEDLDDEAGFDTGAESGEDDI